jgi:hypothetical protein
MYKNVTKEDWARFDEKCESEHFAVRVSTCSGSDRRMTLTTTSASPAMLENRGSGNKRMNDWPIIVLRIHMINSVDGLDHLCMLVIS